ncbi:MAG: hypothetical protein QOH42_375 [Blastocatellia bacterium]|jgi:hypothetical protein|nr:hypothetical protein [Blastocatellia bacterium]
MATPLDIQPDIADKLTALAKARGVSVDDLLKGIIDAIEPHSNGVFSLEEFDRDMDLLAQGLEHLSTNDQGTYSREDIYSDHD